MIPSLSSSSSCSSSILAATSQSAKSKEFKESADEIVTEVFLTCQTDYKTNDYIFLIPLILFRSPTTQKEIEDAKLACQKQLRQKIAEENHKKTRAVVILVNPELKDNRYEFAFTTMTRASFMKSFRKTPEEVFEAHPNVQKYQNKGPNPNSTLQAKGKSGLFVSKKMRSSSSISCTMATVPKDATISNVTARFLVEADERMQPFWTSVTYLINRYNSQISPFESMRTIWDMMSQGALQRNPTLSSAFKMLSPQLLIYWENFHASFWEFMDSFLVQENNNRQEKYETCMDLIEGLEPLIKNSLEQTPETQDLIDTPETKALIEDLLEIQAPWKAIIVQLPRFLGLIVQLKSFLNSTLDEMEQRLKVTAKITPKQLQHLLRARVKVLQEYVKRDVLSPETSQQWNSLCEQITDSLKNHQWIQTYAQIDILLNLITSEAKAAKNSETDRRVAILTISPSQRYLARSLHFIRALERDFRYFILEGSASAIMEDTAEQVSIAFNGLRTSPSPIEQDPIIHAWIQEIKAFEKSQGIDTQPESFTMSLQTYQASLKKLDEIREKISVDEPLAAFIQKIIAQEKLHTSPGLISAFQQIEERINPLIQEWHQELHCINTQTAFIQNIYFLSLLNPSFSPIPLSHILQKMKRLNRRLKEVILPTAHFVTTWNQLKTHSLTPRKSKKKSLHLQKEFPIAAFQTSRKVFETLQAQLDDLKAQRTSAAASSTSVQTEVPIKAAASSVPEKESPETQIQQAFKSSTKKSKVLKQIYHILRAYGIPAEIRSAKGGHKMLMIHGYGITLPSCKELKQGTSGAIENQLIIAVQHAMRSSKVTSSSSTQASSSST